MKMTRTKKLLATAALLAGTVRLVPAQQTNSVTINGTTYALTPDGHIASPVPIHPTYVAPPSQPAFTAPAAAATSNGGYPVLHLPLKGRIDSTGPLHTDYVADGVGPAAVAAQAVALQPRDVEILNKNSPGWDERKWQEHWEMRPDYSVKGAPKVLLYGKRYIGNILKIGERDANGNCPASTTVPAELWQSLTPPVQAQTEKFVGLTREEVQTMIDNDRAAHPAADTYTKAEIDGMLRGKADQADLDKLSDNMNKLSADALHKIDPRALPEAYSAIVAEAWAPWWKLEWRTPEINGWTVFPIFSGFFTYIGAAGSFTGSLPVGSASDMGDMKKRIKAVKKLYRYEVPDKVITDLVNFLLDGAKREGSYINTSTKDPKAFAKSVKEYSDLHYASVINTDLGQAVLYVLIMEKNPNIAMKLQGGFKPYTPPTKHDDVPSKTGDASNDAGKVMQFPIGNDNVTVASIGRTASVLTKDGLTVMMMGDQTDAAGRAITATNKASGSKFAANKMWSPAQGLNFASVG